MLEARNISFGYGRTQLLFEGLNLTISPDERVALSAPSGFGKSTLCRLLAGYEQPYAGEILVDGGPLPRRGACPVQMIWQHPETAVDPRMRMEQTLAEAGAVSQELLDSLGIQQRWLARYPHELSGGELQRFCIARAFAVKPRYLIADEVSTMLDAVTQAQIWQFLVSETHARGIGLVFVSHSAALTERVATRVVNLADNRSTEQ